MELYVQIFVLSNFFPTKALAARAVAGQKKMPFHKNSRIQGIIEKFFYGLNPREKCSFFSEDSGRPCLRYENKGQNNFSVDFNLSHSAEGLALALIGGNVGCARIGCDIEKLRLRKNLSEIARDFFFKEEVKWIFAGDGDEKVERFYRIWTAKEAWLKYYGNSIFDISLAPAFCVTPFDKSRSLLFSQFILVSPSKDTYIVTIAAPSPLLKENLYLEEGWRLRSCEQIYAADNPVNTVSPKI